MLRLIPLLLAAAAHAAPITISETEFAPGSFSLVHLVGGQGGCASFEQINSGNPAPCAVVGFEINGGVPANGIGSWSWFLCFSTQRTIDPSIDGPIGSIDASLDSAWISGTYGPTVQSNGVALRQGSKVYFAFLPLTSPGGWATQSVSGLTAASFQEIVNVGAQFLDPESHPDFTSEGSPIELGFARGNSNGGGGSYPSYSNAAAADNLFITVYPCIAITQQPQSQSTCTTGTALFSAGASSPSGEISYRWQISDPSVPGGWADLSDGAISSNGLNVGTFTGASSPSGRWDGIYAGGRAPGIWQGSFRWIATTDCGFIASQPAPLRICFADFNCDGFVDDADFVLFVTAYNALLCDDPAVPAPCAADLNGDGLVEDTDFVIFVAAYNELVCP